MRKAYLAMIIAGTVIPWIPLVGFFSQHGIDIPRFFADMFANRVADAVALDLLVSAFVFFAWAAHESRVRGIPGKWMATTVALTFGIGLSCGLPFFLYIREGYPVTTASPRI